MNLKDFQRWNQGEKCFLTYSICQIVQNNDLLIKLSYDSQMWIYRMCSRKKVFVKDSMLKRKKCRFYLFHFLDYQMNYYEVWINWKKDYDVLFDAHFKDANETNHINLSKSKTKRNGHLKKRIPPSKLS